MFSLDWIFNRPFVFFLAWTVQFFSARRVCK